MKHLWKRIIVGRGTLDALGVARSALVLFNGLFTGVVWVYGALISLWFGLRLLFGDRVWWLGLINALAIYLFLPLLLLVPLVLVQQIVRVMTTGRRFHPKHSRLHQMVWRSPPIVLSLPLTIFCVLWGKQFIPPIVKVPAYQRRTFDVMTFNTLFNNRDTDKIAAMLAEAQPDILALQEIHPKNRDAVLAALGDYPYSTYHPNTDKHTIGLVSRFPILSATPLSFPPLKRGLKVILDVDGDPLQVIVTHLTPNLIKHRSWPQYIDDTEVWFEQREREMALLTHEIDTRAYPTLLLCDCNMTRTSQNYQDLNRHMTDGFRNAGWGLGWTVFHPAFSFPIVRFDYVWYTSELQVVSSAVGRDAGSDHYPVGATVQFRPKR